MKKKKSYFISIFLVKLLVFVIKSLKVGEGTNFPGKIVRKISPDLLSFLVKQTKKEIITVTGTNGKTTTSGFIAGILETDGRKTVHNRRGANMLDGITTAVVSEARLSGELNADNCLLETDEAFLVKAVDEFNPDIVLVTNLFRDQLDRYGELNTAAKKIDSAIQKTAKIKAPKVILNADDPIVSALGGEQQRLFYGFEEINFINRDEKIVSPQETANCKCGERYNYTKVFYGHLGHFYCSCGEKRPAPHITANASVDITGSQLTVKTSDKEEFTVNVKMPGLYNAYNALAAISAAVAIGISPENIKKGFENYYTVFGRAETLTMQGKTVLTQLIKNPAGATEVIGTVKDDENGRLLIIINDNYADGRDVSWLWDTNFELVSEHKKQIIVSGTRAYDMAVRLKYAGIKEENIIVEENIRKALQKSLSNVKNDEILYILPTYTALLALQKIQRKFVQKH